MRESAAADVGGGDGAACESLVCLGCASGELYEYRAPHQLVRATEDPDGAETTSVDDEEVLDHTA